ncbi:PAS domain S-box protein [Nitratireductor luteus]|uniref:PAS domain S-box protein n=1 Tax=Nitratireductor luteus TaxID=2976980 RepID=UPI0022404FFB|nr:PAS domain S-box protein [Nitratireductor luteus]
MSAEATIAAAFASDGYDTLLVLDQGLLDALPVGLYICSTDGMIQRFNRLATELWMRTPKAGDNDERYCGSFRLYDLTGKVLPHACTPMEEALRSGKPQRDKEVVIERLDGSRITVLVNIQPLKSATGKVLGAINCFQDITAAKRAEESLKEAEQRHQAILNAIPAAVYTTDADGHITYFNRAAAELAGREPELGKDKWCVSWRLYNEDGSEMPHDSCPMAVALKEERPVRGVEALAQRPDGTRVPFRPYPTPLFDPSGALTGGINMLVDVSEEHKARIRLDESEAKYRRIFDGAHVALWDQDFSALVERLDKLRAEGVDDIREFFKANPEALAEAVQLVHVRDVNQYTVDLFEADDKSAMLGKLGAIFLPESEEVFLDEIVAIWEGRRTFESEAPVRTFRGHRLDVLLTIAWEGEKYERSLVSILDISKQKAAQRRFETLNSVAQTVSSDLDLERVVQDVTDSATKLSGAQFGAFFYNVTDASGEKFTLYALSGAPREAFERFGVPRNTAVFEPTFRGTGIVRSDDIRKDPRYGHNAPHHGMPEGHLPVVSYLAVPVISPSGEVQGGLFFGHEKPGAFSEDTEQIVAGIAAHAAMAIENARLLRTVQNELRHRQEAELNVTRLASIVESSQDAIVSKNLDGIITSWNHAAERLFGYTADEVVGRPVTTLFPDELVSEEDRILERLRRGERIEHYETVRKRKDGAEIDISLTVSPVKDAQGRVVGASKIARDVSERKRAEEALARRMTEQAALYRMTDRLYHGTSLADAFDAAIDAITSALGCRRASILLFDENQVMRFVAWRGLSDDYRRAVDGHSPWTAETRDAAPIYVASLDEADLGPELRATIEAEHIAALAFIPLFSQGRVVGKFMTYYDQPHDFSAEEDALAITIARQLGFTVQRFRAEEARQRAEQELRTNQELERKRAAELQAIMEAVPAAIFIARDADCRTIGGNRACYDLLRMPAEANTSLSAPGEERPDHFEVRVNGRVLAPEELPVQRAARGEEIRGFEEEIHFVDGQSRFLIGNATPLRDDDGRPSGAVAAFVDITERRAAEINLRDSEQRLQMALEAGGMGAWEWEVASGKVNWSPTLEAIHGLEPGTFGGTFEDFKRDIHPDDIAAVTAAIEVAAHEREPYHAIYRAVLPDGSLRWLETFGRCVEDHDGSLKKLTGICMDITQRKAAEAQREIMIAELSHRVKNALATVVSIARQSFSKDADPRHAYRSFEARIRALAQTHGRLAEAQWAGVVLKTILDDELAPYRHEDGVNVRLNGPSVSLPPKPALALGMAFHELATNAAKYGAFSVKDGCVEVNWKFEGEQLRITWAERNGPEVAPPTKTGFGRLLLERVLAADFNGKVDVTYGREGVRCAFTVPIAEGPRDAGGVRGPQGGGTAL